MFVLKSSFLLRLQNPKKLRPPFRIQHLSITCHRRSFCTMEFPKMMDFGKMATQCPTTNTTTKSSDSSNKISLEATRWCNRCLPHDLKRSDIYVQVDMSSGFKIMEDPSLDLGQQMRGVVEEIMYTTYTGSQETARFVLKVNVTMISDGGVVGTMMVSSQDFTWLGEAVVGLAWALFPNLPISVQDAPKYEGGLVVTKQPLEVIDFLDFVENHGALCVVENLTPHCAHGVISQIGIGATKYYKKTR
jgi:hypothetical protein